MVPEKIINHIADQLDVINSSKTGNLSLNFIKVT